MTIDDDSRLDFLQVIHPQTKDSTNPSGDVRKPACSANWKGAFGGHCTTSIYASHCHEDFQSDISPLSPPSVGNPISSYCTINVVPASFLHPVGFSSQHRIKAECSDIEKSTNSTNRWRGSVRRRLAEEEVRGLLGFDEVDHPLARQLECIDSQDHLPRGRSHCPPPSRGTNAASMLDVRAISAEVYRVLCPVQKMLIKRRGNALLKRHLWCEVDIPGNQECNQALIHAASPLNIIRASFLHPVRFSSRHRNRAQCTDINKRGARIP